MTEVKVKCPYCGSEEISLYGKNAKGKQRYLCKNQNCKRKTFILDYTYNACKPHVKETAFMMIMNGSGTRAVSHFERDMQKEGKSWKEKLRYRIAEIVCNSKDLTDFFSQCTANGSKALF